MYLYFLFVLLSLVALCELNHVHVKEIPYFYKGIYALFIFIFLFLSTFRWENGTDWDTYYSYFHWLDKVTTIGYMEPGFTLLTSVNSKYFNYTVQLGSIAFLSIIPVAWRYSKISPYFLFSLLIWYTTTLIMFPVRQSVAIALFVYSWRYIEERKLIPFLMITLIAMTFHVTAFIVFPIYYLWNKYYSIKTYVLLIAFLSVISLCANDVITSVLYTIGGEFFAEQLATYMENSDANFGSAYSTQQVLIRGIINRSFLFFALLYFLNEKRKKNDRINALFNLYLYSYIIFLVFTPFSVAFGRLCSYTDMVQAILIPYLFKLRVKSRINTLLLFLIVIIYLFIRFKGVVGNYYDLYVPYHLSL